MELLKDRPDILDLVQKVSQEQELKNSKVTEVKTNEKGEGFLSQICLVTIEDDRNQKLDVIIKAAFLDEKIRSRYPIRKLFLNEIYFYTEVNTIYEKMNDGKPCNFVPICYKIEADNNKEKLCFENLKTKGFEIFDKKQLFDNEHISLIFETYGRFHGYSFALQKDNSKKYEEIASNLKNLFEFFLDEYKYEKEKFGFIKHIQYLIETVKSYFEPNTHQNVIDKLKKYENNGVCDIFRSTIIENCDHSTILHGDCWSNNMMFKYMTHSNGTKLVDMRFLDMQIVKTGSPVCDLSYCLYSGASQQVIDNLEKYLKIYHQSLSSTLDKFGYDVDEIFSYDDLKQHWKIYSKFGMLMSLEVHKMKLVEKSDILDFTDDIEMGDLKALKFNEEEYKRRIKGILLHMTEIDAL